MKANCIIQVLAMLFYVLCASAQQGINYKAIIHDADGDALANSTITIQFTILENGTTNVYQETHSPTTDDNGIIIVNIGEGTPISGDYSTIDWGGNPHFLKTEIDIGAGLVDMGMTEFKAIPYALYANNGNGAKELNDLSDVKYDGSSLFVGQGAGTSDDGTDNKNTALGNDALSNNTSGTQNTAIGYQVLYHNQTGNQNVAIGSSALILNEDGSDNTAIGQNALFMNQHGVQNVAIGNSALNANKDSHNTAVGFWALRNNTTARHNTAIGAYALRLNTTGQNNTAIGNEALFSNTEGNYNNAIGYYALKENTTGVGNVAIGNSAGRSITDGDSNVLVGLSAGYQTTTGTFNIGIGTRSLENNVSGSFNVALGYGAGPDSDGFTNTGSFGYSARTTASNNFVFGNNQVVGWGFGVSPGSAAIKVGSSSNNGNGATLTTSGVWTDASDRSKKYDIEDISYGLKDVMKLRPVTYKLEGLNTQDIGFIAQEISEVIPEIVFGEEGEMTMSYSHLTSVLTKAIQEQQALIEVLKERIEVLENQ
jgi:hypothetical protein